MRVLLLRSLGGHAARTIVDTLVLMARNLRGS